MGSGAINLFRKGSGRTVVVLSRAGGAGAWNPYLDRLSEHFDVIAPPPHGIRAVRRAARDRLGIATVPHYVDLLAKLDVDRFDLVGASSAAGWPRSSPSSVPERIEHVSWPLPGLHVPDAPPADLFTMSPPEIVRALFYGSAIADAALSVPPTPEAAEQAARDGKAFERFARDPLLHDPELPGRLPRITTPTLRAGRGGGWSSRGHTAMPTRPRSRGRSWRVAAECGHALLLPGASGLRRRPGDRLPSAAPPAEDRRPHDSRPRGGNRAVDPGPAVRPGQLAFGTRFMYSHSCAGARPAR